MGKKAIALAAGASAHEVPWRCPDGFKRVASSNNGFLLLPQRQ